jgi:hypothetical protein
MPRRRIFVKLVLLDREFSEECRNAEFTEFDFADSAKTAVQPGWLSASYHSCERPITMQQICLVSDSKNEAPDDVFDAMLSSGVTLGLGSDLG